MSNKVLILGAVNIDIITDAKTITKEDSNLSTINMSFGGVGGNISFNMASLGVETHMLTVLSNDYFTPMITKVYKDRNIELHYEIYNKNSNIYMAIMNQGEMVYGFNDMDLINQFSISFIQKNHSFIDSFDTLILDNNLPIESLEYLASTYQSKTIAMDAVSISKAPKLHNVLKYLDYLKVNREELSILSSKQEIASQLKELHQKGVKHLLVTNKDQEILLSNKDIIHKTMPIQAKNIVNPSGCGDAFLSGFMYGIINKKDTSQCLDYAKKQAYKTLFVKESTI